MDIYEQLKKCLFLWAAVNLQAVGNAVLKDLSPNPVAARQAEQTLIGSFKGIRKLHRVIQFKTV